MQFGFLHIVYSMYLPQCSFLLSTSSRRYILYTKAMSDSMSGQFQSVDDVPLYETELSDAISDTSSDGASADEVDQTELNARFSDVVEG